MSTSLSRGTSAEFVGKSGGVDIAGKDLQGQADPKRYPDWLYQGDAMLGALLKVLEQRGLADNTIVYATSDNGAEHRSLSASSRIQAKYL